MHGDRAVIRPPPNLFSRVCWESLDIEDDTAELSEPEYKKNGDLHCRLKIRRAWVRTGAGGERDAV